MLVLFPHSYNHTGMVYQKHYSVRHDDMHLMKILTNGILSTYLASGTALVYKWDQDSFKVYFA